MGKEEKVTQYVKCIDIFFTLSSPLPLSFRRGVGVRVNSFHIPFAELVVKPYKNGL
jgi:hypothetical protein